jgi:subtilase family serine protease
MMRASYLGALYSLLLLSCTGVSFALGSSSAAVRITQAIDETNLVAAGSTLRLAPGSLDEGLVSDSMPMDHLYLQLKRPAGEEQALESLMRDLTDPNSSRYHQWLTAQELGERFGPASADIDTVLDWLRSAGFKVNGVFKSGLTIDLSGTAGEVRNTFHTEIHRYLVNGSSHIANASAPMIPAALAPVVAGMVSLNNFMPKPQLVKRIKPDFTIKCTGCPDGFNNAELYLVAPADLATIYNVAPLYTAKKPITGKGVSVVVLEDGAIKSSDVSTFRKAFGLSSYSGTFHQIHPGPGCAAPAANGAEGEAALDAEWAGAVAPDADVYLASCSDTTTNFGGFIAAQNLLDSAPPAIMSLSYGNCEADDGPGPNGNGYLNALWQQAAAEGVSVFVSAGDGAAAGCDNFDTAQYAVGGIAANGFASTPYNVATGGTDFLDAATNTIPKYWKASNAANGGSAKSYIPETPWNDSCAGSVLYEFEGFTGPISFCNSTTGASFLDIIGGSGAPSAVYPKPYWQQGTYGMPNDGARDLPDISLFASNGFWNHAILLCMSDAAQGGVPCNYSNPTDAFFNSAGGTSFTAPQLASIQALIDQKAGGPQGNPNPVYYDLAKSQYGSASKPHEANIAACNSSNGTIGSSACMFHDVTVGTNDVPCYGPVNCYNPNPLTDYGALSTSDKTLKPAFLAHPGWDFTSGLGTLNVTNVVNAWP